MVIQEEFLIQRNDLINRCFDGWYFPDHKQEVRLDATKQKFRLQIFNMILQLVYF